MIKMTVADVNEIERVSRNEAPVRLPHETLAELCAAWRRDRGVARRPDVIDVEGERS